MKKIDISAQLDDLDYKILGIMLLDTKISYNEMGKKLFVSQGTIHHRIKKMTDLGIITGQRIIVDQKVLGYDITAFLGIYLEKSNQSKDVAQQLKMIPEIVSAHYTTGQYSIFAKLVCKDTEHLRNTLSNKIQSIAGIQRTETFISLEEMIERPIGAGI